MATTRLMPLHAGKGRSVAAALGRTSDYVKNPDKTAGGELVSSYGCNPAIVDQEFLFSKRQYAAITGRERKDNDVIAYHLRQSFRPGEIDPETANKIGYELAMQLTKGNHAFIVCTHVDKSHIHSHIIFNSTSLDCTRKFRNFWRSTFAVRKMSDLLCLQNGLSIIETPKDSVGCYGTWLGEDKRPTVRGRLTQIIDDVLSGGCKDFDGFIAAMQSNGVEVKQGKYLAFKLPGGKRFVRCDSLGDDYSAEAIMERISGKRIAVRRPKSPVRAIPAKPNMLLDIQAKIQQAHSPGFEKWAKIYNLKEMSKTLIYLQEKGMMDYDILEKSCDAASKKFDALSERSKANSRRMADITELEKQIGAYIKTHEVYAQYRKLSGKKQATFYAEHTSEITTCQAAKRHFDSIGIKKLPTIQSLKQEYAKLSAENKKIYLEYKEAKAEMIELLTAKNNVDRILGMDTTRQDHQRGTER